MTYPLGKQAFVSYRGDYVDEARLLAAALQENEYCKRAVLVEPEELAVAGETLLPYEFIELMEFITDRLASCQSFVYLATNDYAESYFTQAEVLQWRRFQNEPRVYAGTMDKSGKGGLSDPIALEPMPKDEKKLWAKFSVGINRGMQGHLSPVFAGGRFSKNCFLVPCRSCGEHFLISQKAMREVIGGARRLQCPHCYATNFQVSEGERRGNFYRKPIRVRQAKERPPRVLDSREIMGLIISNDDQSRFPLVTADGERLRSDMAKIGLVYGGMAALAGIGLLFASLGSDDR
jgi:hypothetical protein